MSSNPNIQPLSEISPFIAMMLYSEGGWGKTVFAGSHPRSLILSADPEGVDSATVQGSEAEAWILRTYDDVDESYRWLRDKGHKEFDWVCVDTLTEVQRIFQKDWLEKNRENAGRRHPEVLGMDGYQITQNQLIAYVKKMNDLPMHKLYNTLTAQFEDEDGETFYLPMLHGQKGDVSRQVNGYMKVTGYGTYADDGETRRIYFNNKGAYRGKDRFDALGDFRDELTLPKLEKIVKDRVRGVNTGAPKKAAPAKKKAATNRRRPANKA